MNSGIYFKFQQTEDIMKNCAQRTRIFYLIRGQMKFFVGKQEVGMSNGDIFVINFGETYSAKSIHDGLICILDVDIYFLQTMTQCKNIRFLCYSQNSKSEDMDKFRMMIQNVLHGYLENDSKIGLQQYGNLCMILDYLARNYRAADMKNMKASGADCQDERILDIIAYIGEEYQNPISLKELAKKYYITEAHLSRIIKKTLGVDFRTYLYNVRLEHAKEDLAYTGKTILQISDENGFSSLSLFNKKFLTLFGQTPTKFRQNYRNIDKNGKDNKKPQFEEIQAEKTNAVDENVVKRIIVKMDTRIKEPYIKPWKKSINGGAAPDLLNAKVQAHIIKLKQKLGFSYVRFWGIFLDSMMVFSPEKTGKYYFNMIDEVIVFLNRNGLKPFIQIGPKPKMIIKEVGERGYYVDADTQISNMSTKDWGDLINSFINHVVEKFGEQEVENWIFEMWSPCPWDDIWYQWYDEEKYEVTYKVIKKAVPAASVGGCEFAVCWHLDRLKTLADVWKRNKVTPDFLSFLAFPYTRTDNHVISWITDPDYLQKMLDQIHCEMQACNLEDKKLFLTSWNNTMSNSNILNDSVFKGSYIIKNAIDSIGRTDSLVYWLATDAAFEYYNSSGILDGGVGLMTKDGIMKPAAYAFSFLNSLYDFLIVKEKHFIVTGNGDGKYAIVYHNLETLNYSVYEQPENELICMNQDSMFENQGPLSFSITLNAVSPGEYYIKRTYVNSHSGSIMDEWKRTGSDMKLSEKEKEYLAEISIPRKTFTKRIFDTSLLTLSFTAETNEFGFFEIDIQK